jgi:ABC-type glutathione transport system ATPase component
VLVNYQAIGSGAGIRQFPPALPNLIEIAWAASLVFVLIVLGLKSPPNTTSKRPLSPGRGTMTPEKTTPDTQLSANPSSNAADGAIMDIELRALYYGAFRAVRDTRLTIKKNAITAFIGPSGCGKSTVLRSINRMNDLVRGFRFEGHVHYRGRDSSRQPRMVQSVVALRERA